jgi:hypothetical protein
MTKDELIAHLEYCTGDSPIVVLIDGKEFPILDVQHRTSVGHKVLLITQKS